jgi:hypothetical protein
MGRVVALAVLLSALFLPGRSGEARANVHDDLELLGLFHDPLAVHGEWISEPTRLVVDTPTRPSRLF